MAKYDLSSMLNYTLTATSADTLAAYIGHSEGTIQAFAGFSLPENKELAAKVNLMVALAPVWCKWGAKKSAPMRRPHTLSHHTLSLHSLTTLSHRIRIQLQVANRQRGDRTAPSSYGQADWR